MVADVPVLGAIPFGIPRISLPHIPAHMLPDVARSAAMLAALGAIDSLLTSLVADSLTGTFHDSDRELTGQVRLPAVCLGALLLRGFQLLFRKSRFRPLAGESCTSLEPSWPGIMHPCRCACRDLRRDTVRKGRTPYACLRPLSGVALQLMRRGCFYL